MFLLRRNYAGSIHPEAPLAGFMEGCEDRLNEQYGNVEEKDLGQKGRKTKKTGS